MSNESLANTSHRAVLAEIVLLPFENEDDEIETLSVVEEVTTHILNETSSIEGYTSQVVSDERRSAGVIVLLGEIAHQGDCTQGSPDCIAPSGNRCARCPGQATTGEQD